MLYRPTGSEPGIYEVKYSDGALLAQVVGDEGIEQDQRSAADGSEQDHGDDEAEYLQLHMRHQGIEVHFRLPFPLFGPLCQS